MNYLGDWGTQVGTVPLACSCISAVVTDVPLSHTSLVSSHPVLRNMAPKRSWKKMPLSTCSKSMSKLTRMPKQIPLSKRMLPVGSSAWRTGRNPRSRTGAFGAR
jgi:hypothetical protein